MKSSLYISALMGLILSLTVSVAKAEYHDADAITACRKAAKSISDAMNSRKKAIKEELRRSSAPGGVVTTSKVKLLRELYRIQIGFGETEAAMSSRQHEIFLLKKEYPTDRQELVRVLLDYPWISNYVNPAGKDKQVAYCDQALEAAGSDPVLRVWALATKLSELPCDKDLRQKLHDELKIATASTDQNAKILANCYVEVSGSRGAGSGLCRDGMIPLLEDDLVQAYDLFKQAKDCVAATRLIREATKVPLIKEKASARILKWDEPRFNNELVPIADSIISAPGAVIDDELIQAIVKITNATEIGAETDRTLVEHVRSIAAHMSDHYVINRAFSESFMLPADCSLLRASIDACLSEYSLSDNEYRLALAEYSTSLKDLGNGSAARGWREKYLEWLRLQLADDFRLDHFCMTGWNQFECRATKLEHVLDNWKAAAVVRSKSLQECAMIGIALNKLHVGDRRLLELEYENLRQQSDTFDDQCARDHISSAIATILSESYKMAGEVDREDFWSKRADDLNGKFVHRDSIFIDKWLSTSNPGYLSMRILRIPRLRSSRRSAPWQFGF